MFLLQQNAVKYAAIENVMLTLHLLLYLKHEVEDII